MRVGCRGVLDQEKMYLAPLQLGLGTKMGAEAAIHSVRTFLHHIPVNHVLVKFDFKNAFNSIRRDVVLKASFPHNPSVLSYYASSSHLLYDEDILLSQEGVQQGDP